VALEHSRGGTQPVLRGVDLSTDIGGPGVTPECNFGETGSHCFEHFFVNAFVDSEEIRSDRKCCCAIRSSEKRRKPGSKIDCRGPQDAQRPHVIVLGQQDVDIPARHTSVEQPSPGRLNDVSHTGSDDIELVPEEADREVVRATAPACFSWRLVWSE
jgi:hypothetical protein